MSLTFIGLIILGLIALILGVFVAIPLISIVLTLVYLQLDKALQPNAVLEPEQITETKEKVRLASQYRVLIHNDTEKGRHRLAVSLSEDEGGTWKWTRHLEDDTGPESTKPCKAMNEGAEIAYCEIIGQYVDTTDNHDGLRIEHADGARIHHNMIHGVQGKSGNSCGIKVYKSQNLIVEDNYVYDNTRGIFDKDSGINNTYRRNYLTKNRLDQFHGNNQGQYMRVRIHDNVIDGTIALGYLKFVRGRKAEPAPAAEGAEGVSEAELGSLEARVASLESRQAAAAAALGQPSED